MPGRTLTFTHAPSPDRSRRGRSPAWQKLAPVLEAYAFLLPVLIVLIGLAAYPLIERGMVSLDIHVLHGAHKVRAVAQLDGALPLLNDSKAARLLLFGNMIAELERGGVRTLRILEAED